MRIDTRNKVVCNDGTFGITNGAEAPCVNNGGVKDNILDAKSQIAQEQLKAQLQIIDTQKSLTDKVFGKSRGGFGLDAQRLRLGAYIILGAFVGRYVSKKMSKSTTLGMVLGGLTPLLAYKLSIEYDKKNSLKLPTLEPKKVALEPNPKEGRDRFGMPLIKPMTMAEEREMAIKFFKTLPDEFVLNNVKYSKNSNLEFYKQTFADSGLIMTLPPMRVKISGSEFNNAYIEFRDKDLPKSVFEKVQDPKIMCIKAPC